VHHALVVVGARGADGTEPGQHHTKTWNVRVDISEEGDVTRVHAVLDAGGRTLQADAVSGRNPDGRPVPEIGARSCSGLGSVRDFAGRSWWQCSHG
jgi:hypothetical protein